MENSDPKIEFNYNGIVSQSVKMMKIFSLLKKVSATPTRVLIQGESGTGKEMVARAIHLNSLRNNKHFVAVDCGAIPDNLLESELFGYAKGAFTGADRNKKGLFEEADQGTLFLDEIGNMNKHIQAKFLRAIQEKEIRPLGTTQSKKVDVRIISASRHDLKTLVKQNRFREDLYFRLNVVSINLPPLREREGDISILTEYFIKHYSQALNKALESIDEQAIKLLEGYYWPGNVRELENVVERAVTLADHSAKIISLPMISEPLILEEVTPECAINNRVDLKTTTETLANTLERVKREMVQQALLRYRGNKSKTAASLGLSRCGLNKMMKKWGLALES
jgi:two-component system, NtrC family, response regulator AtoC